MSCTVSFDPETEARHLPHALDYFQYHLKVWSVAAAPCRCRGLTHSLWGQGVSFLPRTKTGAYAQMPYEAITEEAYYSMVTPSGGRVCVLGEALTRCCCSWKDWSRLTLQACWALMLSCLTSFVMHLAVRCHLR